MNTLKTHPSGWPWPCRTTGGCCRARATCGVLKLFGKRMNINFAIPLMLLSLGACKSDACRDDFCHFDAIAISACVSQYSQYTGSIPSVEQGLEALVTRPADLKPDSKWVQLAKMLPCDPWGNPFRYVPDRTARPQRFAIITLGPDGVPSGDDRIFKFTIDESKQLATEDLP